MSTNAVMLDENTPRPRRVPPPWWRRAATWGLALGLVFLLAGDRGARSAVPDGIDPLEVLNLQVRANAIIVLDSSGSMSETLGGNVLSGDDRNSKMVLAKQVIRDVVSANQDKISFQFGKYVQPALTFDRGTASGNATQPDIPTTGVFPLNNALRFAYSTTSTEFPVMATGTELQVDLRSYDLPAAATFNFREAGVDYAPVITVAARKYATGTELAADIQTAMNALTGNDYSVTYNSNHTFSVRRPVGSNSWIVRGTLMSSTVRAELGLNNADSSSLTTGTFTTPNTAEGDVDLYRRNTAGSGEPPYTYVENSVEYYRMFARRYFNGKRVNVLDSGVACSVSDQSPGDNSATNPPYVELQRVTSCAPLTTDGSPVKFVFGGASDATGPGFSWGGWLTSGGSCGGFDSLVDLAECTVNLQLDSITTPYLEPEIRIRADGSLDGYAEDADGNVTSVPSAAGIKAAGFTPIAESLIDIKTEFSALWSGTISTLDPKPRTFVIFVTDGDDTCTAATVVDTDDNTDGDNGVNPDLTNDGRALRAAYRAQLLYERIAPLEPASSVTTFVVAFGTGAQEDRADWIAWGGSGMTKTTTGSGDAQRWNGIPTAAERAACTTCQDAFVAANASDLASAIQTAIDQGQSVGEFSDQQSITESVYEFVKTVPVPSPSAGASPVPSPDPLRFDNRYSASVPILLQSTFEMPQFKGHLNAFRNVNDAASPAWASTLTQSDAGQKLYDRLFASLGTSQWTFLKLRGDSLTTTDATIGSSTLPAGTLRRRIYTTSRNGVFTAGRTDAQIVVDLQDNLDAPANGPGSFRVPIWPPTAAVDPAGSSTTSPPGSLDNALGIGPNPLPPPTGGTAPAALTLAQLKAQFGACTAQASGAGSTLPSLCSSTTADTSYPTPRPERRLAHARKEARQIILAYTAGAALVTNNGLAVRTGASGCTFNGTTCGALQFSLRSWIMAESTLAAPAVVTPPLESGPSSNNAEYTLYRDGPRNAGDGVSAITFGFGLRNPDKDDEDPAADRPTLKPVMSTVYHATNAALHAFRAGPCPLDSGNVPQCNNGAASSGANEAGGEELWAFVPYDQLQNLKERMKPQARDPHTYMLASPVRFADVFVPGDFNRSVGSPSTTVSGSGVWRLVILFGRGIAGKYYTALDVTAPGEFTRPSLNTRPPIPLWSRGNPDVHQGGATPTANNNAVAGNTDATDYLEMGQTWSVPAVGFVSAASNVTARRPGGVAYVAYTGSGFASGPNAVAEGSTFFTLDMLTGDVVAAAPIAPREDFTAFQNALVAGPSAFNPSQLRPGFVGNSAANTVTRVYFPDIQGRIWRILSSAPGNVELFADLGADQPVGNPLALLNYTGSGTQDRPHVFAESGNDNRVTPPPADTPPFRMYGLRDEDLTDDPDGSDDIEGPARVLFTLDFANLFRGTVQPATAFNDQSPPQGRVFFAGNRFNLPGSEFAPTPPPCVSSFDSVIFAVGAESGNAAFDLTSDDGRSIQLTGQRVQAVRVAGGRLVVDTGLGADVAPPPPAPPTQLPPQPAPLAEVIFGAQPTATALLLQPPATFKVGSSVCR